MLFYGVESLDFDQILLHPKINCTQNIDAEIFVIRKVLSQQNGKYLNDLTCSGCESGYKVRLFPGIIVKCVGTLKVWCFFSVENDSKTLRSNSPFHLGHVRDSSIVQNGANWALAIQIPKHIVHISYYTIHVSWLFYYL